MTDPRFDLLVEPWIPVVTRDAKVEELSIREVLAQSHELSGISDPWPTVEFGIYRFLVALVSDIYRLDGVVRLEDLIEKGCFVSADADSYFEKWGDRFELFHPQYPFMQTPGMSEEKEKPLSALVPVIPSGTSYNFFHHQLEDAFGVSPKIGARLLMTIPPFMGAGGAGLAPSINGSPPWYVLVKGKSLFETLCLNASAMFLQESADPGPAWRNGEVAQKRYSNAGLLEGLTWRPRRIQLVPTASGKCSVTGDDSQVLIRTMKFTPGAACDFTWHDPSVPYSVGKDGPTVVRPREDRELWRDTGSLVLLRDQNHSADAKKWYRRPALVDQYVRLTEDGVLDRKRPLIIAVYGMRIKDLKMNYQEWYRESLNLPTNVVASSTLALAAQRALDRAELAGNELRRALKRLYPRNGAGNDKALDALITNTLRAYWSGLRLKYEGLINALSQNSVSNESAIMTSEQEWVKNVRKDVVRAFDDAARDFDSDADAIKRQVEARRLLVLDLWKKVTGPDAAVSKDGKGAEE